MNNDLDLTQDSEYPITINKFRDLNQPVQAEVYSGCTFVGFFDYTQYTGGSLQVRVKQQDNFLALEFNTTDGSIVFGADGKFYLVKTANELKNVRSGVYFYDMYLSSALQSKRAFLSGVFHIKEIVSR